MIEVPIPAAAPMRRFRAYRTEIDAAIARVLDGDDALFGPEVAAFEASFAASCDCSQAIGVASGTDALKLALQACGISPGDEVLLPALTAPATAQAVKLAGAVPVFVDVERERRTMDPDAALAAIGPRTAAILPVHLHGVPAEMMRLRSLADRHGLFVIEDCAQAHGASEGGQPVGSFGHAAAWSFYPTKNLGCIGDGGAVTTSDPALAERVRALAQYGWQGSRRISEHVAGPSRLDALQAAVLNALLPHLPKATAERRTIARQYRLGLEGLAAMPADIDGAVWHQFVIEVEDRDRLRERLAARGIGTAIHYDPPLHHHPALRPGRPTPLPVTEHLCRRILSLPMQPEAVDGQADAVVAVVREALGS